MSDIDKRPYCLVCGELIKEVGGCLHEIGYWHHIECSIAPEVLDEYIKQLIEKEVYTALIKELSQMLDDQIVKPEYHNLVVGKVVGYKAKLENK